MSFLITSKTRKTFHNLVTLLSYLLVITALIIGIWFFIYYKNNEETNDAQVEQYVTPIQSRITGFIKEVRFEDNQFVRRGDTLVIIDNNEYQSHLDLALAEEETAKKEITIIEKSVSTINSTTFSKNNELDAAKAEVWKTKLEFERYSKLFKEEAATAQQLEKVRTDYETAKAKYNQIIHTIQSIKLNTTETAAKVPKAKSIVKSKVAAVKNASLFLSYTVITAPYDGWVGKRTLQPGQLVKEGQNLVAVVSKEKWIVANFKETQIQYLKIGQEVTIKIDALSGKEYQGKIESFSPASGARFSLLPPDNATGNFVKIEQRIPVKIKFNSNATELDLVRAGMNVLVIASHTQS
ncbi:MAG: HlyD family secretion protein [Flavobacterium sp.]